MRIIFLLFIGAFFLLSCNNNQTAYNLGTIVAKRSEKYYTYRDTGYFFLIMDKHFQAKRVSTSKEVFNNFKVGDKFPLQDN